MAEAADMQLSSANELATFQSQDNPLGIVFAEVELCLEMKKSSISDLFFFFFNSFSWAYFCEVFF